MQYPRVLVKGWGQRKQCRASEFPQGLVVAAGHFPPAVLSPVACYTAPLMRTSLDAAVPWSPLNSRVPILGSPQVLLCAPGPRVCHTLCRNASCPAFLPSLTFASALLACSRATHFPSRGAQDPPSPLRLGAPGAPSFPCRLLTFSCPPATAPRSSP